MLAVEIDGSVSVYVYFTDDFCYLGVGHVFIGLFHYFGELIDGDVALIPS